MYIHDATEEAYKNGYEAGFKDAKAEDYIAGVVQMTRDMLSDVQAEEKAKRKRRRRK